MDSLFTFIVGLFTAALSLLGFAQTHPELPQSSRDSTVEVVQQAVQSASNTLPSKAPPPQTLKDTRDTLSVDAQGNIQIPESIRSAGEDISNIYTLELISLGLKQHYIDYKRYPSSLKNLVNGEYGIKYYDPESIESSFIIILNKTHQDEFFAEVTYTVSSDQQHYVLSRPLKSSKDRKNKFQRQESSGDMVSAEGIVLGINCSDKRIFCLRGDSTSEPTSVVKPTAPVIPDKGTIANFSVHISNQGVGLEKMDGSVVMLNWLYNGKFITGARVERKTVSGSFHVLESNYDGGGMYFDKTVEEGKTYTYRVKVNITNTESTPYSSEVSIFVPDSGTKISGISVNTTTNTATISFMTTGPTTGSVQYVCKYGEYQGTQFPQYCTEGEYEVGYPLEYKTNHTITVPNLQSGTSYKYRVIVGNKQGTHRTTDFLTLLTLTGADIPKITSTSPSIVTVGSTIAVNGPMSLAVGQVGTWKVSVPGATRFAVIWADGSPGRMNDGESGIPHDTEFATSSDLTHAFSKPGTYYPQFFTKSSDGKVDVRVLTIVVQ